MNRREFVKTFGAVATVAGGQIFINDVWAIEDLTVQEYAKILLVDENNAPIQIEKLEVNKPYIFFYPYNSTPVYLIKMPKPVAPEKFKTGGNNFYEAPGGIGKDHSLVAYSAICAHQWSYPSKEFSPINFYPETGDIKCCVHMSLYDAKKCAEKIDGPAMNNLAMIVLEYNESKKELYATGTAGIAQFCEFFDTFKQELRKDYGSTNEARRKKLTNAVVVPFDKFCLPAGIIKC